MYGSISSYVFDLLVKPPLAIAKAALREVRNLELWSLLRTNRSSTWAFQRTDYWTPKIHDDGHRQTTVCA